MPLTARISNDKFDVVHFRLSVIVRAKDVPNFLQGLCSGKQHKFKGFHNELPQEKSFNHNLITILKTNIDAINLEDKDNRLYRYGPDAAVKVELLCEYVFDKKGYDEVKPASVQKKLEAMIKRAVP